MWGVGCRVEGLEVELRGIERSPVVMLTSCTPVIAGLVICARNLYKYTYVYTHIYIYTYVYIYTT